MEEVGKRLLEDLGKKKITIEDFNKECAYWMLETLSHLKPSKLSATVNRGNVFWLEFMIEHLPKEDPNHYRVKEVLSEYET